MPDRWSPSVTVAAIAGRRRAGSDGDAAIEYLLVEEETPEGLRLNNPAGHLDPGESPAEAVVREALEETACVFVPEGVVGVYLSRFERPATNADVTYLRLAFAGSVGEPDPSRRLDAGIVRTLWMTLAELHASRPRHRSPLVLRCIEDFAAGHAFAMERVVTDASVYTPDVKR
jgi:8-oxo-dGTP pyrophosphatase MutT (NUDIX family)